MLLIDNDVVRKIATFDLIDEFHAAFNSNPSDLGILPTLRFQLRLNTPKIAIKKLGSEEVFARLSRWVADMTEISDIDTEAANVILSMNTPNIDAGEKTLLAALFTNINDTMISGDKRFFMALAGIDLPEVKQCWPRLICLEHAILRLTDHCGFEVIADKIRQNHAADTAISVCFGRSERASVDSARMGMLSYVEWLKAQCSGLYIL